MESIGWNRTLRLIQLNDCDDPHRGNAVIAKAPGAEVPLSFARRLGLPASGGALFVQSLATRLAERRVNLSEPAAYEESGRHSAKRRPVLIWIKFRIWTGWLYRPPTNRGMCPMPSDALLLSIAICCVFALFAGVLAWLDHNTTAWLRARAAENASSREAQSSQRAA